MLANVLSAPFATAYPPLLLQGALALQALLLNAWPQMTKYRGEVMRGVSVLWCQLNDDNLHGGVYDDIRAELQGVVQLLKAVLSNNPSALLEIDTLIEENEVLAGLQ